MKNGKEVLLVVGTQIPTWILAKPGVKVEDKTINGKIVLSLILERGDALFCTGGGVDVKTNSSGRFLTAFDPLEVLEIRDLSNNSVRQNHFLCTKCFANTGVEVDEKSGFNETLQRWQILHTFQCSCGNTWKKII
ncbi:MAG: hypothetical protein V1756_00980 [Patescibacteria group bacterium]